MEPLLRHQAKFLYAEIFSVPFSSEIQNKTNNIKKDVNETNQNMHLKVYFQAVDKQENYEQTITNRMHRCIDFSQFFLFVSQYSVEL